MGISKETLARWFYICVFLCILLGAALRLHGAGDKSFNGDELSDIVRSRDLTEVIAFNVKSELSWLPAGYILISLASRVGSQEFVLRFPAIACGILTLPVIYQLGRHMFGRMAGLVALFLAAISPFYIAYSQNIRMYPYFFLTSALVYYFLYRAVTSGGASDWIGLAVSFSLSLRTQHIAKVLWFLQALFVCMVLAVEQGMHLVHRFVHTRRHVSDVPTAGGNQKPLHTSVARWYWFALCQVLIYLLSYRYANATIYDISVALRQWISPPLLQPVFFPEPVSPSPPPARITRALVVNFLDTFSDGNWYDKMALWDLGLFIGLWLVGGLAACARGWWRQLLLIGLGILTPWIALTVMGTGTAWGLEARYFGFILPLYIIPIGYGTIVLSKLAGLATRFVMQVRWLRLVPPWSTRCLGRTATIIAIVLLSVIFVRRSVYSLRIWYNYEAQNWKDVARLLATSVQDDECIVSLHPTVTNYYLGTGYGVCPSRNFAEIVTQYSGIWYVRLNYRLDQYTEQLVQSLGFATVRFDGYWGDGILVSHWRNGLSPTELKHQLVVRALAIAPNDPSLHVNLAEVYFALGEADKGIGECRRALQTRPDYQPAYQMLVAHYLGQGDPKHAEWWIRQAFAHNRYSIWPYNLRGQYYQDRGMMRLAIEDFYRAIRLNPYETWNSYGRVAYLYRRLQRWDDLLKLYQMAIRYNSDEPWAHMELARVLKETGDLEGAVSEYEKAIHLDPGLANAYLALANVYMDLGQHERIPVLYQQAVERNPGVSWPLVALGDFYRDSGDPSLALVAYKQAYALNRADSAVRQRIGETHWNLADHLDKVSISSASGRELIRGIAKAWYKPYPSEPVILVSSSPLTVGQQVRPAQVLYHPFSEHEATCITFTIPSNPYLTLSTSYALADSVIGLSNGVDYRVEVSTDGGNSYIPLVQATVTQNHWVSQTVSLVPFWNKDVMFRLTSDARGDYTYDWLLVTFDLQAYADIWDLVADAWTGSGQCEATRIPFNRRGFIYQNRRLITRSTLPVQGVAYTNQVQFHPCSATESTVLSFPLKGNPFAALVTSYGLADEAVGHSNGVEYRISISSTLNSVPTLLFETQVTENEWRTSYLDLTSYQGQDAVLLLSVSALGNDQYDWLQVRLNLFPVPLPPTYVDRQVSTHAWR